MDELLSSVATPVSNPVAPEATEQAPTATPVPTSGTSLGTFNVTHYAVGDGMTPSTRTANGTDVFSDATGASKLSTYPKLNAGNLVDIIGESGTRYQVRIAAKYIGYVEKSNIKNPNTPAATTTKKYPFVGKVTASKLNVRKKPGTEHPLLPEYPMLNKDNLINVLGVTKDTKGDRWYKVSITKKEYVGYVSAKYIIKA